MNLSKTAYVSYYNAKDIHNWSGLGYYISNTIENEFGKLDYIGDLQVKKDSLKKIKQISSKLLNKSYTSIWDPGRLKFFAEQVEKRIIGENYELLFGPGPIPFVHLKTDIPIVTWTDSCFPGLVDFYSSKSKFSKKAYNNGLDAQQIALKKCTLSIYSSEWAANIAKTKFDVDPKKIKVVPFGANVESTLDKDSIEELIGKKDENICKLLFVGVDWNRKGADIVVGVAEELHKQGINVQVEIVGCNPPSDKKLPDYVNLHGFVSKSTTEGRNKINRLFNESHFLFVPSRAEAYGLVFCEANAFGMPAIASNVGGINTIIKDDINGKKFPLESEFKQYSNYIGSIFSDRKRYIELAKSSFNEYETRLNWEVAGKTVRTLLEELQ
ncbi:MAG: glycosyltransferase [Melioribacteraceae bacterium]|nr:glycosyltransferase [Melioribacteraceae bacterium]